MSERVTRPWYLHDSKPHKNLHGDLCGLCDGTYEHEHPELHCVKCGVTGLAENMNGPVAWHQHDDGPVEPPPTQCSRLLALAEKWEREADSQQYWPMITNTKRNCARELREALGGATMSDTRPTERIQHSHIYGDMILKLYGKEAWKHWQVKVARQYDGERRAYPDALKREALGGGE